MLKEARLYMISTFCDGKRDSIELYMNRFEDILVRLSQKISGFDLHVLTINARPCEDKVTKKKSTMVELMWICKSSDYTLDRLIERWDETESLAEFSSWYLDLEV